jgi:hypothetical protein
MMHIFSVAFAMRFTLIKRVLMLLTLCETFYLRIVLTYSLAAQRLQDTKAVQIGCDTLLSSRHVNT